MEWSNEQIIAHRLKVHHLDQRLPAERRQEAAAVCGLLNSPPGSWETAMMNRTEVSTAAQIRQDLEEAKTLLQSWSLRGAPMIFPVEDNGIFLAALAAQDQEMWIYTNGLPPTLKQLELDQDTVLNALLQACSVLEETPVRSKSELDRVLAEQMESILSESQRRHWREPSLVAEGQTLGQAAVSYLLRACAFKGKVCFGARDQGQPVYLSPRKWLSDEAWQKPADPVELVRRYLHAYGPVLPSDLAYWLGCGPAQAKRLWKTAESDMEAIIVEGKKRWILKTDREAISQARLPEDSLRLLGPHDPYLDLRDRQRILADPQQRKKIWKLVGNPGAILGCGRIIGLWKPQTRGTHLTLTLEYFEPVSQDQRQKIQEEAQRLAVFRGQTLQEIRI